MTRDDERITGIFVLADGILRFFFFFIPRRPRVCVVVELCCVSSAHGAYCPLLAVCSPRETNFSPCLPREKETCPSMATDDGLIIRHQPRVVKTYHPRFFSFCIPRRQLLFFFLLLWISAAAASSFWRVLANDRVDLLFFFLFAILVDYVILNQNEASRFFFTLLLLIANGFCAVSVWSVSVRPPPPQPSSRMWECTRSSPDPLVVLLLLYLFIYFFSIVGTELFMWKRVQHRQVYQI